MSEAQFTEFAGYQLSPELRRCITDCLGCYSTCLETVTYSLEVGGQHAEPARIRLLLDCADICQTAAAFMLRTSDLHQRVCTVCAEVCEQCAESCAQLGSHPQMRLCSEVCVRCADSCRQMARGTEMAAG